MHCKWQNIILSLLGGNFPEKKMALSLLRARLEWLLQELQESGVRERLSMSLRATQCHTIGSDQIVRLQEPGFSQDFCQTRGSRPVVQQGHCAAGLTSSTGNLLLL